MLLTIADYQRLTGEHMSLLQALEQGSAEADFAFEPVRLDVSVRPADPG